MPENIQQTNEPAAEHNNIVNAITDISEAMKKLNDSRLKREAIVALIHCHSKIAKSTIREVLANLDNLEAIWLKPNFKKAVPDTTQGIDWKSALNETIKQLRTEGREV